MHEEVMNKHATHSMIVVVRRGQQGEKQKGCVLCLKMKSTRRSFGVDSAMSYPRCCNALTWLTNIHTTAVLIVSACATVALYYCTVVRNVCILGMKCDEATRVSLATCGRRRICAPVACSSSWPATPLVFVSLQRRQE